MTVKKICANKFCRQEFTPTPCRTPHRQKYCPACVQLSQSVRTRQKDLERLNCDNPACTKTFEKRNRKQRYCCTQCRLDHEHSQRTSHRNGHMVVAKCPRCGAMHRAAVRRKGKGTPLLFCVTCNAYRGSEVFSGAMLDYVGMASYL